VKKWRGYEKGGTPKKKTKKGHARAGHLYLAGVAKKTFIILPQCVNRGGWGGGGRPETQVKIFCPLVFGKRLKNEHQKPKIETWWGEIEKKKKKSRKQTLWNAAHHAAKEEKDPEKKR